MLVKCCHLQPAGPLLASCPSAFPVPSERRLTDKPSCLAFTDPPTPERELSHPSAGPDTTATPTKQLFTPKHPEEEAIVLIMLQHRGRASPPAAREPRTNPSLCCSSSSLSLLSCCSRACHLSSVQTPAEKNQQGGGCSSKRDSAEGQFIEDKSLARSGTPGSVLAASFPRVREAVTRRRWSPLRPGSTSPHLPPTSARFVSRASHAAMNSQV